MAGYGEATLPPYLPDTRETVLEFLQQVQADQLIVTDPQVLHAYLHSLRPESLPAIAAIDIAWHDLQGKLEAKGVHQLYELNGTSEAPGMFTIGISNHNEIQEKVAEAGEIPVLKIKTGNGMDKAIVETIRRFTGKPIALDANQSWKKDVNSLKLLHWLNKQNILFVEQPFHKNENDLGTIYKDSPVPIIADESFQTIEDLDLVTGQFHGINIKLMKCGGIYPAIQIIKAARKRGLRILIGCMSESSCGCAAASQLIALADWYDLDGPLLLRNDPFKGLNYLKGRINIPSGPGTGVLPVGIFQGNASAI